MAFDIMNKMMDGVEEEKIIEEYEKSFKCSVLKSTFNAAST